MDFLSGIWGEQCIIFRDQGSADPPPWGASSVVAKKSGFGEQRKNTFRELMEFLSGTWGEQCIIFRDQGSTDPLGGLTSGRKEFHI